MDKVGDILIDGMWQDLNYKSSKIDPKTNEVIYDFSNCNLEIINHAVESARKSLSSWKNKTLHERLNIINNFADLIGKDKEKIANVIIADTGKPYIEAETEVIESIDIATFYTNADYSQYGDINIQLNNNLWPNKKGRLIYSPRGVYAVIKPWNYPFELPLWSIIPILIAGNTIVFKPSELSTKSSTLIAHYFELAGLPKGVINVTPGGRETGDLLVRSHIDAISFTGSEHTGHLISNAEKINFPYLSLELGGNDAAIIMNDADIELASSGIVWGAFTNAGQVCTSVERILVHNDIYEKFKESIINKTNKLTRDKDFGPLINKEQKQKVMNHFHDAISKGGKLITQSNDEDNMGNYFRPSIIEGADTDCIAWQEETFGPLAILERFTDNNEAIIKANSSRHGLGASIWTSDNSSALEVANKLSVGMAWINEVNLPMPELPWLGIKSSGVGINLSIDAVFDASNKKALHEDISSKKREWWFPYD